MYRMYWWGCISAAGWLEASITNHWAPLCAGCWRLWLKHCPRSVHCVQGTLDAAEPVCKAFFSPWLKEPRDACGCGYPSGNFEFFPRPYPEQWTADLVAAACTICILEVYFIFLVRFIPCTWFQSHVRHNYKRNIGLERVYGAQLAARLKESASAVFAMWCFDSTFFGLLLLDLHDRSRYCPRFRWECNLNTIIDLHRVAFPGG